PAARPVVGRGADRVRAGGEDAAVPGVARPETWHRQLDRAGGGDPAGRVGGGAGDRRAARPAGGVVVAAVGREADRHGRVDRVVLEAVGGARAAVGGPVGLRGRGAVAAVTLFPYTTLFRCPAARPVVGRGADRVRAGGE